MRVTEQIDALESLGRSPASHLIIPRVLAGLIMIPALTVFADLVGVVAGGLWAVKAVLPVTDADFIYGAQYYWRPFDAYYSRDQGVLLRRRDHDHLLLHGLQHPDRAPKGWDAPPRARW